MQKEQTTQDNRIVTKFGRDNLTTVMAFTYGHTIPLETVPYDQQHYALRVKEQIPDQLLPYAKQVCWNSYNRYFEDVLRYQNNE